MSWAPVDDKGLKWSFKGRKREVRIELDQVEGREKANKLKHFEIATKLLKTYIFTILFSFKGRKREVRIELDQVEGREKASQLKHFEIATKVLKTYIFTILFSCLPFEMCYMI